jgi:hypothetical protein
MIKSVNILPNIRFFTPNEMVMYSHQEEGVDLGFHIFPRVHEDYYPIPCQEQQPPVFLSKHHRLQRQRLHRLIQELSRLEFLDIVLDESSYLYQLVSG